MPGELPEGLFAGAPDLTKHDSFPEVRDRLARRVANERAVEEVETKLADFKDNVMLGFVDKYDEALAQKSGEGPGDEARRPGEERRRQGRV